MPTGRACLLPHGYGADEMMAVVACKLQQLALKHAPQERALLSRGPLHLLLAHLLLLGQRFEHTIAKSVQKQQRQCGEGEDSKQQITCPSAGHPAAAISALRCKLFRARGKCFLLLPSTDKSSP